MEKKFPLISKTSLFMLLVGALTPLTISCSGGGGGGGTPPAPSSPGPIAGLCSHAFDPASSASMPLPAPAATATANAPVALSTCSLDSNRNVVIGSGACGPNVYVDQSFTGTKGLGSITINSDGQLVFLHDPGFQVDTSGIVVNGKFQVGNSFCPVGSNNKSSVAVVNFTDARAVSGVVKGITVNKGGTLQL